MTTLSADTVHFPIGRWLLLLLVLLIMAACGSRSRETEQEMPRPTEAPVPAVAEEPTATPEILLPTPEVPPTQPMRMQAGNIRYDLQASPLPGAPAGLAVDGTTIWVAQPDDGAIMAVDVTTAASRTLEVGGEPYRLATGEEGLWAVDAAFSDYWVRRIDPASGATLAEVRPAPGIYPGPRRVAPGGEAVWTPVDGTGALVRIDPATNGPGDVITDRPNMSGGGDAPLLVAFGSVWVIDSNEGRLLRVDPAGEQIVAAVQDLGYAEKKEGDSREILADGPVALGANEQGLWVLSDVANTEASASNVVGGGALFLIDPASNQVVQRIDLKAEADKSLDPALVLVDATAWFVEMSSGYIVRVDLVTGEEIRILPLNRPLTPTGIAAIGDLIWVAGESFGGDPSYGLFGIDRQAITALLEQAK
ncbi:MAG: hypothetical protein M5U01_29905 [Ardenticatenaceae bacterium]|nr:hypothetical protein [Ardenticatenaceae bacterium]